MAVFWKTCTASEIYLLLRKRTDAPVIFLFQKNSTSRGRWMKYSHSMKAVKNPINYEPTSSLAELMSTDQVLLSRNDCSSSCRQFLAVSGKTMQPTAQGFTYALS